MNTVAQSRSNAEWIDGLRAGDARTVEELRIYVRNGLRKVFAGNGEVGEADIEDFTQDALLRIHEKLDTFRGDSRLTTWAMAVAVRTAYGMLRKRRYRERPSDTVEAELDRRVSTGIEASSDPGSAARRNDLLDHLRRAIDESLTERQRQAILDELAGMPSDLVAKKLGINKNALYKMLHDARKKLRRALNEAGFSDEDVRQELAGASNP